MTAVPIIGVELAGVTGRLGGSQVQELTGVVPLVDGLGDVDAVVALEPDELASGPRGERLGDLGLADARLAFEQQRPLQAEGEEDRGGESDVGEVAVVGECGLDVFDGFHRARG